MPLASTRLRRDLREHLGTTPALTALVGGSIHHGRVPAEATFPALVYQVLDLVVDKDLDGACDTGTCTLALECWAESYGAAEGLAIAALEAFPLDLTRLNGGRRLLFVTHIDNGDEIPADPNDGSDSPYFGQSVRVRVGFYSA